MNVLSLFDGISGGQLGLKDAEINVKNYLSSEIDKYAINITQYNFPNTIQLGDVENINFKKIGKIDLLIAGSPCQGFSLAGKQLNFKDSRSKLFFKFVKALKEVKPKYFLLENVRMKKEFQNIISEELEVQPILINSALVTAQNRQRLYWTNIKGVEQPEDKHIKLKDIIQNGYTDRIKSYCIDANYCKGASYSQYKTKCRRQLIFNRPITEEKYDDFETRKLTPVECERLQGFPDNYTYVEKKISNTQRYKSLGNSFTVPVISHILSYIK